MTAIRIFIFALLLSLLGTQTSKAQTISSTNIAGLPAVTNAASLNDLFVFYDVDNAFAKTRKLTISQLGDSLLSLGIIQRGVTVAAGTNVVVETNTIGWTKVYTVSSTSTGGGGGIASNAIANLDGFGTNTALLNAAIPTTDPLSLTNQPRLMEFGDSLMSFAQLSLNAPWYSQNALSNRMVVDNFGISGTTASNAPYLLTNIFTGDITSKSNTFIVASENWGVNSADNSNETGAAASNGLRNAYLYLRSIGVDRIIALSAQATTSTVNQATLQFINEAKSNLVAAGIADVYLDQTFATNFMTVDGKHVTAAGGRYIGTNLAANVGSIPSMPSRAPQSYSGGAFFNPNQNNGVAAGWLGWLQGRWFRLINGTNITFQHTEFGTFNSARLVQLNNPVEVGTGNIELSSTSAGDFGANAGGGAYVRGLTGPMIGYSSGSSTPNWVAESGVNFHVTNGQNSALFAGGTNASGDRAFVAAATGVNASVITRIQRYARLSFTSDQTTEEGAIYLNPADDSMLYQSTSTAGHFFNLGGTSSFLGIHNNSVTIGPSSNVVVNASETRINGNVTLTNLPGTGPILSVDGDGNVGRTNALEFESLTVTGPTDFQGVISGDGSGLTNLLRGPTVSAGANVTITPSKNPDGSTNYQVAASGGGGGSADLSPFIGYRRGLGVSWNSTSSVTVATGALWSQQSNAVLKVETALTTNVTGTADTWVYLYYDSPSGGLVVSATAPAAPYSGTARTMTGNTAREFLFPLRLDGGGGVRRFHHAPQKAAVTWVNRWPGSQILSTGTATTSTSVDASAAVPPQSTLAQIWVLNSTPDASVYIGIGGEAVTTSSTGNQIAVNAGRFETDDAILSSSQTFSYILSTTPASGGVAIVVRGFTLER